MFKIILMFKRKSGLTRAEFIEHYEKQHVPLAHRIMPPLEIYRRNYIVNDDPLIESFGDGRADEEPPFDVITEAIYGTREEAKATMDALFDGETSRLIMEDEAKFVEPGSIKFYVVETHQSAMPWR